MNEKQPIQIPSHLRPKTKEWYRKIAESFVLESHHEKILLVACECWDQRAEAREQLAKDGLTVIDKHGTKKPHPCVQIERDARTQFLRAVRELNLDVQPPQEEHSRPPALRRVTTHRRIG
jgi:P27 family predicted phage terminase small subunit